MNNTSNLCAGPRADPMSLGKLPIGQMARVIAVHGDSAIARRMMEMGVIPGTPVVIVKKAPFGDPIEVRVRGYSLAMRKSEAETIEVSL